MPFFAAVALFAALHWFLDRSLPESWLAALTVYVVWRLESIDLKLSP
jgi:hypothetical protein